VQPSETQVNAYSRVRKVSRTKKKRQQFRGKQSKLTHVVDSVLVQPSHLHRCVGPMSSALTYRRDESSNTIGRRCNARNHKAPKFVSWDLVDSFLTPNETVVRDSADELEEKQDRRWSECGCECEGEWVSARGS
jgi:hypothetical protein